MGNCLCRAQLRLLNGIATLMIVVDDLAVGGFPRGCASIQSDLPAEDGLHFCLAFLHTWSRMSGVRQPQPPLLRCFLPSCVTVAQLPPDLLRHDPYAICKQKST
jgi:hypothetical protein